MENQEKLPVTAFDGSRRVPWRLGDIVVGLSILLSFYLSFYAFDRLGLFRYEPWISRPFYFALWVTLIMTLLSYSLFICKRRGFWPLFYSWSSSKLFKELLRSLLAAFLILLAVTSIVILSDVVFRKKIGVPQVWHSATYAPSSVFLIAILILGFAFTPLAEEMFFRGFLYNAMKTRLGAVIAAILQAVAFAVVHPYPLTNRFLVLLLGVALVIVYERRKNLLSPIFVHGIINGIWIIPLLVLAFHNFHIPAQNWDEAKQMPNWLKSYPPEQIDRQDDGMKQWQYAIDKWGSRGLKRWKMEANAFNAVSIWFPNDRTACAKAKLGMVAICLNRLRDYRRAIIEANSLLSQYPDQREQCGLALSYQGWAYLMLKDFKKSRVSFDNVVSDFKEYEDSYKSAQKGIEWLDILEGKKVK